jgi:hypothetical protein
MKKLLSILFCLLAAGLVVSTSRAQTNFNLLAPLTTFGPHGDGSVRTNDQTYIATGDRDRSLGVSPLTGSVIILDRQTNGNNSLPWISGTIDVMNGTNGSTLNVLSTNSIVGTTNGDFADDAIAVADDGVVYMANLVNNSSLATTDLKIWRWNSDSSTNADGSTNEAYLCYTGNPGNAAGSSWGINIDVRGSGPNTQILLGSRDVAGGITGPYVAVFKTSDGTNFTPFVMTIDQPTDSCGRAGGIVFGAGDTFWSVSGTRNTTSQTLYHFAFDTNAGTATTLQSFNTNAFVPPLAVLGPIAVNLQSNLLAVLEFGVSGSSPDHVRLYDIEDLSAAPVLLDIKDFPINHSGTATGTLRFQGGNKLYVHSMNSGLVAYNITGGAGSNTPPTIYTQPSPALSKLAPSGTVTWQVSALRALGYQWQHNGTNISGANAFTYTLSNAADQDAGTYTVVVTNVAGATTSSIVTVQIVYPDDIAHVAPLWNIFWTGRPYLPSDLSGTGSTPLTRSFAYNALSNQLILVCRSNSASPTPLMLPVLDADTGNDLYTLKTNNIVTTASGGTLNFPLNCIAAADDGALYACSTATGNATTNANSFRIYRWANSDPNTIPSLVRSGDPVGTNNSRWGDAFCVRGTGTNTLLAADAGNSGGGSGTNAAVFAPTDNTLNTFTSLSNGFLRLYNNGLSVSIGRSIQLGPANTILQKRKGTGLELATYDLTTRSSTLISNFTAVSALGPVAVDDARHLLAGINFKTGTASDSLDVYDIGDPSSPVLIGTQDFPLAHQPNANFIGQVIIGQNKIFALDANNGMVALTLIPALVPSLTLSKSGTSNTLSWTNSVSGWALQSNTNLATGTWINVPGTPVTVNNNYTVTDTTSASTTFYRLKK